MTHYPGPAPQPLPPGPPRKSRRLTRDQVAMLAVTISVFAVLGAMVFLGVRELPDALAEDAPEPVPVATGATESEDHQDEESQQPLEYTSTEEAAADPESLEGAAVLWYEAAVNGDLEGFEPLTCADPSSSVVADLRWAQNNEAEDGDYTVSNIYVTSREHDGVNEVGIFLIADDPTYDYIWAKESRPGDIITILTVVEEDGGWKVCDKEGFL